MNRRKQCESITGLLVVLLLGFSGTVYAQPNSSQVSYSHDHWPSRWSSAIHQQQTGEFPTREEVQTSPAELPAAVLEQDLFFSPSLDSGFAWSNRQYNTGKPYQGHRFSRDSSRQIRDAAYAHPARYGSPADYYPGSNFNYPYGTSAPGIDPVLGFPGIGIPLMPGIPGSYPIGAFPFGGLPNGAYGPYGAYGFPGSMAMWNPPFGAW